MCFLDLDRFKQVNDSAGHPAGDQLLRELVGLMRTHLCINEVLGRLGGDEFGVILTTGQKEAKVVCERLVDAISRHEFRWDGEQFKVGASIGVVEISSSVGDVNAHLVRADMACYAAKNNGRNQVYSIDSDGSESRSLRRLDLVKNALQKNCYKLLMQSIQSTAGTESVSRYELLLRLETEDGALLEPLEFLPVAKRFSLMQKLDSWVVENAISTLEKINAEGKDIALSINLSANTLTDADTLQHIVSVIVNSSVAGDKICFDITESSAIRNMDNLRGFMITLKAHGVEFALDDFGNGLSSFSYLQELPITYLKIDGELIRRIAYDTTSRHITESFHLLCKKLGIKTVAESVEDVLTMDCVKDIGIDYMQGFGVANLFELCSFVDGCKSPGALISFKDDVT